MSDAYFAGIDGGSTYIKSALIRGNAVIDTHLTGTGIDNSGAAKRLLEELAQRNGIQVSDIRFTMATGYSRKIIDSADDDVSEITAHAYGAKLTAPEGFHPGMLIDIGGQDSKIIYLDSTYGVKNFTMNDKCAAGTGKFMETCAQILETSTDQIGPLSLESTAPCDINSMCVVLLVQTSSKDGTVLATAKSSTLNTQGYDSFAWDSHVFGTEDIPLEFCYGGSSTMSTQATLLCWGKPYSGTILIRSNAGKNESVTITDGVITGLSIRDLRSGVSAAVVEEETGRTLIASYIAEDYLLFSDCDPGSLQALGMLILLTAAGCLLVIVAKTCLKRSRG